MARKKTSFRLDEQILAAMVDAAKEAGRSRNAWIERRLFKMLKDEGFIPAEAELLGETRGGDRTNKTGDTEAS